jgi:hypothetical protein
LAKEEVQFQNGKPQLKGVDTIARIFRKKNRTFKLATEDGNKITIKFPPPSDMESFFVFSLHRSGSTLMNNIILDVCKHLKLSYIDLEGSIFKQGYMPAHINDDISSLFFEHGFAYLGFRSFWIGKNFDVTKNKCLLLIRDPRDAMVSHYFSYLYSHGIPASGPISKTMSENRAKLIDTDINEYVLRPQFINTFKNGLKRYEKFLSPKMTRIYRYEDVIYYKHEWLIDMLEYLGLELPSEVVSRIVKKHDIHPSKEDPSNHIRQVAPGNFRRHLTAETIGKLNSALAEVLKKYGYDQVKTDSL